MTLDEIFKAFELAAENDGVEAAKAGHSRNSNPWADYPEHGPESPSAKAWWRGWEKERFGW